MPHNCLDAVILYLALAHSDLERRWDKTTEPNSQRQVMAKILFLCLSQLRIGCTESTATLQPSRAHQQLSRHHGTISIPSDGRASSVTSLWHGSRLPASLSSSSNTSSWWETFSDLGTMGRDCLGFWQMIRVPKWGKYVSQSISHLLGKRKSSHCEVSSTNHKWIGPHPCWWRVCYQQALPRLVFTSW